MYDIDKARKAQREYCDKNHLPHFAPYDGCCFRCGRNIYSPVKYPKYTVGITVEEAGSTLITGCPFCSASYVD